MIFLFLASYQDDIKGNVLGIIACQKSKQPGVVCSLANFEQRSIKLVVGLAEIRLLYLLPTVISLLVCSH